MEVFFLYLVKSLGILALFFVCYQLLLKQETFFSANRIFLLSGILLSVCLPMVSIVHTVWIDVVPQRTITNTDLLPVQHTMVEESFNWWLALSIIYFTGVGIMLIRLMVQSFSLAIILWKGRTFKKGSLKIVETEADISPCSFFNRIIYNPRKIEATSLPAIFAHEKCHAQQLHSIDVLLANLFVIFQWFNPFAWLYRSAIQQNLEYLADSHAQQTEDTTKDYQYVLLKSHVGDHLFSLVNPFFNSSISSIKKRIVMLNKRKSRKRNYAKFGTVLPILVVFVLLFNIKTEARHKIVTQNTTLTQEVEQSYLITSKTSDIELKAFEKEINHKNATLKITNLKRDKNGLIIEIAVQYKVDGSGEVTGNYNDKEGISPIDFGIGNDGGIYIGSRTKKTSNSKILKTSENSESKEAAKEEFSKLVIHDSISGKPIATNVTSSMESGAKKDEISQTLYKDSVTGKTSGYTINVPGKKPVEVRYGKEAPGAGLNYAAPDHVKSMNNAWNDKQTVLGYDLNASTRNIQTFQNDIAKTAKKPQSTLIIHDSITGNPIATGVASGIKLGIQDKNPLIILDGKEVPHATTNLISPNQIQSMNVWKGQTAISMYGEKAKDGVIEIRTKNSKYNPIVYDKERSGDFPHGLTIRSNIYTKPNPPLYIINGKEAPKSVFEKLDNTNIKEIRVLKGEKALEKYGKKGKYGVLLITSKTLETSSINNPMAIQDYVITIDKNTSQKDLKKIQQKLLEKGMTFTYALIERNNKGELIKIELTLKDKLTFSEGSAYFSDGRDNSTTIPNIVVGRLKGKPTVSSSL